MNHCWHWHLALALGTCWHWHLALGTSCCLLALWHWLMADDCADCALGLRTTTRRYTTYTTTHHTPHTSYTLLRTTAYYALCTDGCWKGLDLNKELQNQISPLSLSHISHRV
jgi:hypothetical protein